MTRVEVSRIAAPDGRSYGVNEWIQSDALLNKIDVVIKNEGVDFKYDVEALASGLRRRWDAIADTLSVALPEDRMRQFQDGVLELARAMFGIDQESGTGPAAALGCLVAMAELTRAIGVAICKEVDEYA